MQVNVYQSETLIGTAILEHLDPPMGVAFGPFTPSSKYDRDKHANAVKGNYLGDKGRSLFVRTDLHGSLKTASIAINDGDALEKELTIWFQNDDDFAAIFSSHDDYKAYYAR